MSLAQLFLQLGIAGALIFVGYRIVDKLGSKALDYWAQGEKRKLAVYAAAEVKRTKAIGEGFAAITARQDKHGELLTSLHTKVDDYITTKDAIKQALEEVTGKHEVPLPPSVAGDDQELELAPPRPLAVQRTTPAGGYSIQKRAGTKGGA